MKNTLRNRIVFFALLVYTLLILSCSAGGRQAVNVEKVTSLYGAAFLKLEVGNFKDAEASFRQLLLEGGKSPHGNTGMAMLEAERGNYLRATFHSKKAIRLDDRFSDAWMARGHVLSMRRNGENWFDEASACFVKALEIDSENERALYYYANSALMAGRFDEASELFVTVAMRKQRLAGRARSRMTLAATLRDASPVVPSCIDIGLDGTVDRAGLAVLLIEQLGIVEIVGSRRPDLYRSSYGAEGSSETKHVYSGKETDDDRVRDTIARLTPLKLTGLSIYPNGMFYPDKLITRAQFATVIQDIASIINDDDTITTRYIGSETPFRDVRNDYYAFNAIRFCMDNDLLPHDAKSGEFRPYDSISGGEALLALRRLADFFAEKSG